MVGQARALLTRGWGWAINEAPGDKRGGLIAPGCAAQPTAIEGTGLRLGEDGGGGGRSEAPVAEPEPGLSAPEQGAEHDLGGVFSRGASSGRRSGDRSAAPIQVAFT